MLRTSDADTFNMGSTQSLYILWPTHLVYWFEKLQLTYLALSEALLV